MLVTSNNRTRGSSTGKNFACVILSLDVSGVSGVLEHINLNLPFPLRFGKVSRQGRVDDATTPCSTSGAVAFNIISSFNDSTSTVREAVITTSSAGGIL